MLKKLGHQLHHSKHTTSNTLPGLRSRKFLANYLKRRRQEKSSAQLKSSAALVRWLILWANQKLEHITDYDSQCFYTGRSKGVSQRFSISRTKVKWVVNSVQLFGVRKSSW